jgi:hypothetical protein
MDKSNNFGRGGVGFGHHINFGPKSNRIVVLGGCRKLDKLHILRLKMKQLITYASQFQLAYDLYSHMYSWFSTRKNSHLQDKTKN